MLYTVVANAEHKHTDWSGREWSGSTQVPTFFVDASSEADATAKARMVVDSLGSRSTITEVHVSAGTTGSEHLERWLRDEVGAPMVIRRKRWARGS